MPAGGRSLHEVTLVIALTADAEKSEGFKWGVGSVGVASANLGRPVFAPKFPQIP